MSDRPHFRSGERPVAEKLDQVSERAYHSHSTASGVEGPGGLALSAEPRRREWEWAKLQADLLEGSEAEARLYRDTDDLATYVTVDVKAPLFWVTDDKTPEGDWIRVERHKPSVWYMIDPPRPRALVLKALINMGAGLLTTDANITIDNVTIMQPHNAIMHNDPETTVDNTLSKDGDDDGVVYMYWNTTTSAWEGIPDCPA